MKKGVFSETPKMFQGLDTVATHIKHGRYNFKYCTLAGIKKLRSASPFVLQ
jgi:hypothetical protein